MSSITVKNGKVQNPVVKKIILTGVKELEIILDQEKIVSAKQAFCAVSLTEHYLSNKEKYGEPEDFLKYLSCNFKLINLETQKGIILGTEINSRFLTKLNKLIKAHILIDWHRKHGQLKDI